MDRSPAAPRYRYELGDNHQSSYVEFVGTVDLPILRFQRGLAVDNFVLGQLTALDGRGYRYLLGGDDMASPVQRADRRVVLIRRNIEIDASVVSLLNALVD